MSEWDGKGLPPVGVECEKIFDGTSEFVTPLYYDNDKSGMVMFYHKNSWRGASSDYDWCLVENCIFLKIETEAERNERERLEAAIELHDVANLSYYDGCLPFNCGWDSAGDKVKNMWLTIVDKTGYRKERQ